MSNFQQTPRLGLASWLTLLVCCFGLLWGESACFVEDLPRDGLRCLDPGADVSRCLPGWRCDVKTNKCVRGDAPADGTPPAETSPEKAETTTETALEKTPEIVEESVSEETVVDEPEEPTETVGDGGETVTEGGDGGPEEPVQEAPPEQAAYCNYSIPSDNVLCPLKDKGCERFSSKFTKNASELPSTLVGAAAVVKGDERTVISGAIPKKFVYLVGGGDGTAGGEIYFSEVTDAGKFVKWQKGGPLKKARIYAQAYIIDNYLYVFGGEAADGSAVGELERAVLKADGTLGAFQVIGTWANARAKAGIAYKYGYFYMAGGLENGSPSKTVERILLQADGRLGRAEKLDDLPEAHVGPLVATQYFLVLIGTKKVRLNRIQPNGMLEGWCSVLDIPVKDVASLQAVADTRRIFLYGLEDSSNQLNNKVYFSSLQQGDDTRSKGAGLDTWRCSDHKDNSNKALLLTPRKGAAVAIVGQYFFLFGGADDASKSLKTIEGGVLHYRESQQCDLDRDGKPYSFDFCPQTYDPTNKNNDQPSSVKRPGASGWVESFGLGDACESDGMRLIPAGKFTRGATTGVTMADAPSTSVELDGFYIDKNEVTNSEYAECVKQTRCKEPTNKSTTGITNYYGDAKYKNFPVVQVSWDMARTYCEFRGKRLPTEAEWEKAARGLLPYPYPWGTGKPSCEAGKENVNFKSCTKPGPKEVGKIIAGQSDYGVFDLAGNVREWVADYYVASYYNENAAKVNPKGPTSGQQRVIRGGSYLSDDKGIYTFKRDRAGPTTATKDLGFRCARDLYPKIR